MKPSYRVSRELVLPLNQIIADTQLQPRVGGLDPAHVRQLAQVAEQWPPLIVIQRKDQYFLTDGFHRYAAAPECGLQAVPVIVLEVAEDEDLRALAFSLNAKHGRPLTMSDRQAEAVRQLKAHPEVSNREIARRCGLAQATIAKIRKELEADSQIPAVETRTGRDGRNYTSTPKRSQKTVNLLTVLGNIAEALNPNEHRAITRYLLKLADSLEEQDRLKGFETFEDAAKACRLILGEEAAKELAERLGWSSNNILQIAIALGYRAEGQL